MKKGLLVALLCVSFIGTSCVSHKNKERFLVKQPQTILELNMQDFSYLGTIIVEVEYKKYGFITKLLTVNGEAYNARQYKTTSISHELLKCSNLKKALYKVHEQYPDADYILPIYKNKDIQYMNGGRIIKETVTLKVYKLK